MTRPFPYWDALDDMGIWKLDAVPLQELKLKVLVWKLTTVSCWNFLGVKRCQELVTLLEEKMKMMILRKDRKRGRYEILIPQRYGIPEYSMGTPSKMVVTRLDQELPVSVIVDWLNAYRKRPWTDSWNARRCLGVVPRQTARQ